MPDCHCCGQPVRRLPSYAHRARISEYHRASEDLKRGIKWGKPPRGWSYQATLAMPTIQVVKAGEEPELTIPDIRWELVPDG